MFYGDFYIKDEIERLQIEKNEALIQLGKIKEDYANVSAELIAVRDEIKDYRYSIKNRSFLSQ